MTEEELKAAQAQLEADRKAFEESASLKKIRAKYEKEVADLKAQVKDRDDLISEIMDGKPMTNDTGITRDELAEFTKLLRC